MPRLWQNELFIFIEIVRQIRGDNGLMKMWIIRWNVLGECEGESRIWYVISSMHIDIKNPFRNNIHTIKKQFNLV